VSRGVLLSGAECLHSSHHQKGPYMVVKTLVIAHDLGDSQQVKKQDGGSRKPPMQRFFRGFFMPENKPEKRCICRHEQAELFQPLPAIHLTDACIMVSTRLAEKRQRQCRPQYPLGHSCAGPGNHHGKSGDHPHLHTRLAVSKGHQEQHAKADSSQFRPHQPGNSSQKSVQYISLQFVGTDRKEQQEKQAKGCVHARGKMHRQRGRIRNQEQGKKPLHPAHLAS
jgi:hypothetical protein